MPVSCSAVSTRREERCQSICEFRGGGRFHAQVHLDSHRLLEDADHLHRLEAAQPGLRAFGQGGQGIEQLEVAGKGALDPGAQHLDRDVLARLAVLRRGDREVHLGDRGRRDRRVVEAGEERLDRAAEFRLDGAARLRAGKGRQAVLQFGKVSGQLLAQQIGPGREELAELDETRPQLGQRPGQLLARPALGLGARNQAGQPDHTRRDAGLLQGRQGVVACQAARDRQQAPDQAQRAQQARDRSGALHQRRQAECRAATPPVRLR
jgi:hypothetical protein